MDKIAEKGKYIKVYITLDDKEIVGESLWATYCGDNLAKIDNIPFFANKVGWGDLVKIDDDREFIEVVERATKTILVVWEPPQDEILVNAKWEEIISYFDQFPYINRESAVAGIFSLSVPLDLSEEEIIGICGDCPVPLCIEFGRE